jgi:hypothetical protein
MLGEGVGQTSLDASMRKGVGRYISNLLRFLWKKIKWSMVSTLMHFSFSFADVNIFKLSRSIV